MQPSTRAEKATDNKAQGSISPQQASDIMMKLSMSIGQASSNLHLVAEDGTVIETNSHSSVEEGSPTKVEKPDNDNTEDDFGHLIFD